MELFILNNSGDHKLVLSGKVVDYSDLKETLKAKDFTFTNEKTSEEFITALALDDNQKTILQEIAKKYKHSGPQVKSFFTTPPTMSSEHFTVSDGCFLRETRLGVLVDIDCNKLPNRILNKEGKWIQYPQGIDFRVYISENISIGADKKDDLEFKALKPQAERSNDYNSNILKEVNLWLKQAESKAKTNPSFLTYTNINGQPNQTLPENIFATLYSAFKDVSIVNNPEFNHGLVEIQRLAGLIRTANLTNPDDNRELQSLLEESFGRNYILKHFTKNDFSKQVETILALDQVFNQNPAQPITKSDNDSKLVELDTVSEFNIQDLPRFNTAEDWVHYFNLVDSNHPDSQLRSIASRLREKLINAQTLDVKDQYDLLLNFFKVAHKTYNQELARKAIQELNLDMSSADSTTRLQSLVPGTLTNEQETQLKENYALGINFNNVNPRDPSFREAFKTAFVDAIMAPGDNHQARAFITEHSLVESPKSLNQTQIKSIMLRVFDDLRNKYLGTRQEQVNGLPTGLIDRPGYKFMNTNFLDKFSGHFSDYSSAEDSHDFLTRFDFRSQPLLKITQVSGDPVIQKDLMNFYTQNRGLFTSNDFDTDSYGAVVNSLRKHLEENSQKLARQYPNLYHTISSYAPSIPSISSSIESISINDANRPSPELSSLLEVLKINLNEIKTRIKTQTENLDYKPEQKEEIFNTALTNLIHSKITDINRSDDETTKNKLSRVLNAIGLKTENEEKVPLTNGELHREFRALFYKWKVFVTMKDNETQNQ